jgi:hypothetical protein
MGAEQIEPPWKVFVMCDDGHTIHECRGPQEARARYEESLSLLRARAVFMYDFRGYLIDSAVRVDRA